MDKPSKEEKERLIRKGKILKNVGITLFFIGFATFFISMIFFSVLKDSKVGMIVFFCGFGLWFLTWIPFSVASGCFQKAGIDPRSMGIGNGRNSGYYPSTGFRPDMDADNPFKKQDGDKDCIYCSHCGAKNPKDGKYCSQCGEKLNHPEEDDF
ncbi:MAG: zinc-ribbon domain-containing protein [Bacilli bacterium]